MKVIGSWLLLALILPGFQLSGEQAAPKYRRTTIESILKAGKRIDGARVELRGKIMAGAETNAFGDASSCKHLKVRTCAVSLNWADCTRVVGADPEMQCDGRIIERLWREQHPNEELPRLDFRRLLVVDRVIVRGVVSTVRKDITYGKSMPKSARVGFGHLGGFPAQLQLEELEIEKGP